MFLTLTSMATARPWAYDSRVFPTAFLALSQTSAKTLVAFCTNSRNSSGESSDTFTLTNLATCSFNCSDKLRLRRRELLSMYCRATALALRTVVLPSPSCPSVSVVWATVDGATSNSNRVATTIAVTMDA